jgi:hypothetical protein
MFESAFINAKEIVTWLYAHRREEQKYGWVWWCGCCTNKATKNPHHAGATLSPFSSSSSSTPNRHKHFLVDLKKVDWMLVLLNDPDSLVYIEGMVLPSRKQVQIVQKIDPKLT